jgi:hypothetical protein
LERSALEAPALGERQPVSRINTRGRSEVRAGRCFNCGGEGHARHHSVLLSASNVVSVARFDHLASVCKAPQARGQSKPRRGQGQGRGRGRGRGTSGSDVIIGMVHARTGELKSANCTINAVPLTLLIDLGAKVSLISNQVYQQHFRKLPLYAAPLKLIAYDGGTITALGCFDAKVTYKGIHLPNFSVLRHG